MVNAAMVERKAVFDDMFFTLHLSAQGDYGKELFSRPDFQRLADVLTGIRDRFMMLINDAPQIREIFAWAQMEEVQTTYTIAGKGKAKLAAELLISRRQR